MSIQKRNPEMVGILSADFVRHLYYENSAMRPVHNVQGSSYGAEADGATDDRAAFVLADDAAVADGGLAYAPPGEYYIGSSLTLSANWFTAPGVTFVNVTPTFNARYELGLGSGGAVDHGSLAGLSDNDHTQYLNAAGDGLTLTGQSVALTAPGSLSASSPNAAAGNHTHAITASSNPGASAALLKTDASGYLTLTRLGIGITPNDVHLQVAGSAMLQAGTPRLWWQDTTNGYHWSAYMNTLDFYIEPENVDGTFIIRDYSNVDVFTLTTSTHAAYFAGDVGIGTTPAYPLHIQSTTSPQIRLAYDATTYFDFSMGAGGALELTPSGNQGIYFWSDIIIENNHYIYSQTAAGSNLIILGIDSSNNINLGSSTGNHATLNIWKPGSLFAKALEFDNTDATFNVPVHILTNFQPQLKLSYDGVYYTDFRVNSTGNFQVYVPYGDFTFNLGGDDILPFVNYDLNLGAIHKKYLRLFAAELWVETLVAQDTIATIGGRILVGPTTTLTRDLSDTATTIYVKHNQMASGDIVYMEAYNPSAQDGGPITRVEFMQITSAPTAISTTPPDTEYSYTVSRAIDPTSANFWYAGDAMFNTGTTGQGFIDLYSLHGVDDSSAAGPTIVGNVRNSATYNDWTEHWAIGNLNGLYGYGADTYGAGFGEYSAAEYLTIDSTNGIRFYDANDVIRAQLSGTTWTLGYTSAEHVEITTTAVKINDGATTYTSIEGGVVSVGNTVNEHVLINTSGVHVKDGSTVYAVFASTTTVGLTSADHVSISSSGIEIKDGTTVKFLARTDGNMFIGSDVSVVDGVYFAIFSTAQTYFNSESMAAGDMLIGDNSANKANILWDKSAGQLLFRGGQTAQAYIDTSGSVVAGGGDVALDNTGMRIDGDASALSNVLKIKWLQSFPSGTEAFSIGAYHFDNGSTIDRLGKVSLAAYGTDSEALIKFAQASAITGSNIEIRADGISIYGDGALDENVNISGGLGITGGLNLSTGDFEKGGKIGYIYVPITPKATNTSFDGDSVTSSGATYDPGSWDTGIPNEAVALVIRATIKDATVGTYLRLGRSSTDQSHVEVYAQVANEWSAAAGIVNLDSSGNFYLTTGGNAVDSVYIEIMGYFV